MIIKSMATRNQNRIQINNIFSYGPRTVGTDNIYEIYFRIPGGKEVWQYKTLSERDRELERIDSILETSPLIKQEKIRKAIEKVVKNAPITEDTITEIIEVVESMSIAGFNIKAILDAYLDAINNSSGIG